MVPKCLLIGFFPLVFSGPTRQEYEESITGYGGDTLLLSVLKTLYDNKAKKGGREHVEYASMLDMDKTIIKKNLPETVLLKQIELGDFRFGSDDVKKLFGFETIRNTESRKNCFNQELMVQFDSKVGAIQSVFLEREERIKLGRNTQNTFVPKEIQKLTTEIQHWSKMVQDFILYKNQEHCSYTLLTKEYRLLHGFNKEARDELIKKAFEGHPEKFAYKQMLDLIHILKDVDVHTYIITATHLDYLNAALAALKLTGSIAGTYGTTPTNEDGIFTGEGTCMSGKMKGEIVNDLISSHGFHTILSAGDSDFDSHMLEESIKGGVAYALLIQPSSKLSKNLEVLNSKYPGQCAIQRVNAEEWLM
ncbi:unnamed protein product [Albugo candida]|uniref:NYN domain-containing protein n=1 Tax=Albugo candida TaxID=65357 RepID=A0A024FZQ6_9STRA|nr:unnamed protein product [Albugo candida]|eukprot:CCI39986.1 unnamed protein product [Albugo candida]